MRLWVRLALVMAGLAVIPLLLVGASATKVATRQAEGVSEALLRREATVQAELLGRWIHDQARLVLSWPQLYADRLSSFAPEFRTGFARMVYKGTPTAATVVLVNGHGHAVVDPVYSTTGDRPISSEGRAWALTDRLPVIAALLHPDVVHLGKPWLPEGPGTTPSLPLAVLAAGGVRPSEQYILGVEVPLELTEALLLQVTGSHAVALVDEEGHALVGGDHPLIQPDRLRPLMGTGKLVDFVLEGEPQVRGSIAPVPNTPGWGLVVAESAAAVLQSAVAIRSRMIPSVLLTALGALGLAFVVAGSLSRPVELLRNAALQVGDGALGTRVDLRRSDEIGDLARAFDHMSVQLAATQAELEAQQQEIEAFNRELQQRVDARTRELRAAQDQLVRSGQLAAVAELGAGLAHDLNNPLTSVLGIAQLLRDRSGGDRLIGKLEQEAQRCREVVAAMLKVSTLEVDPTRAPVVDLHSVLQQVNDLLQGTFRQRGVGLQLTHDGHPDLRVRVDPAHCTRLLTQVIGGVRAGLDPGATVTVSTEREGTSVVVKIESDHPIADRLDRRDDLMASGHNLWVARQLVDRLGGRLEEVSDGTTWRMVLPGA
ncbi:MAG TPA: HAMP domain-containing histidine kinase [Deltaproteobacteria bacterium]|nr:HAMP domain-containing histidine kinase [Deltaproteobacteria bacterium]